MNGGIAGINKNANIEKNIPSDGFNKNLLKDTIRDNDLKRFGMSRGVYEQLHNGKSTSRPFVAKMGSTVRIPDTVLDAMQRIYDNSGNDKISLDDQYTISMFLGTSAADMIRLAGIKLEELKASGQNLNIRQAYYILANQMLLEQTGNRHFGSEQDYANFLADKMANGKLLTSSELATLYGILGMSAKELGSTVKEMLANDETGKITKADAIKSLLADAYAMKEAAIAAAEAQAAAQKEAEYESAEQIMNALQENNKNNGKHEKPEKAGFFKRLWAGIVKFKNPIKYGAIAGAIILSAVGLYNKCSDPKAAAPGKKKADTTQVAPDTTKKSQTPADSVKQAPTPAKPSFKVPSNLAEIAAKRGFWGLVDETSKLNGDTLTNKQLVKESVELGKVAVGERNKPNKDVNYISNYNLWSIDDIAKHYKVDVKDEGAIKVALEKYYADAEAQKEIAKKGEVKAPGLF